MAGAGTVRRSRRVRGLGPRAAAEEERRDWAGGLPDEVLEAVARKAVAQNEAGWAAQLKKDKPRWTAERIQRKMAKRRRDGYCPLFVFARVCKNWRKAQLRVGGRLRTRVKSDVILPGRAELVKWALAEGCPRECGDGKHSMAEVAAKYGHLELVEWLCEEGGFAMDETVVKYAAKGGNLLLVQWLRGKGCPWNASTCYWAVHYGHVEVLRWARENGCEWEAEDRDKAAELGYTDDFGNLVDFHGNFVSESDAYDYDYPYDYA